MIYFPAKVFQRDFLKFRKKFSQFLVDGFPEMNISAQNVFIKAGLAFVQTEQVDGSGSRFFKRRIENSIFYRKHKFFK